MMVESVGEGVCQQKENEITLKLINMKKFVKAIAAIMLMVAVVLAAGCKKTDDPNNGENNGGNGGGGNGGGSNPTVETEGIYLGIIGFNQHLYEKEISLLNESTKMSFMSHIDGLEMKDGTGLYWADNTAIKRLHSFGEPPRLTNVALVTFTDGLDNVSLDDNETNPDNYPTKEAYLDGLCNKIRQGQVHNKDITAYTIGLRGNDVNDLDEFHANLKKLASTDSNGIEVSDMNQALQKFTEIAESLHSVTTTASLTLLIPPGYNDGQICRFTFDDIPSSSTAAENSTSYIECTYKRTENGRRLENITYHGWQTGASSVSSFEKVDRYYKVAFENLTKGNGDLVSNDDKRYLQLFYKTSSGEWQVDSEFKPDTFSDVIEEQSSALILLVLDCTTSLGGEFSSLKDAAKRFVKTLVSSNNGGGGGGNGGGNTIPTVTTSSVTEITSNYAMCGGNVTSDGGSMVNQVGICWSTSHNPTTNDSHSIETEWTGGSFSRSMQGLASNTTYYVRAFATNAVGTGYGQEKSFTTLSAGTTPTVSTSSVTSITQNSATCGGNVTSDGGATVTARGVCWSTSQNPTVSGSHTTDGTGTGSFTSNITGLTAGQSYYVRAYATNSAGTSYGEQKTINTISVPTVTTDNVTDIREQSAWCGGNVTSDGGATVTERGICWSTSSNPTINSSHISSGSGTGSFTVQMTGLSATTTYYVRAYAKNSAGVAYGTQKSFKTGEWLEYVHECTQLWGLTEGGAHEWAVMFPASTIYWYEGSITRVIAYCGMAGSYTLKIYKGGTTQPSTLMKSQNFSVSSEGWQSIDFSSPLALPRNTSLWVSIRCTYSAGNYPCGSGEGVWDADARWEYVNGTWRDTYDYNGNTDLCWSICTLISSNSKGEEGMEIQLPLSPNTQGSKEPIKSVWKPIESMLKAKLNK